MSLLVVNGILTSVRFLVEFTRNPLNGKLLCNQNSSTEEKSKEALGYNVHGPLAAVFSARILPIVNEWLESNPIG